jgi:hypothetical protein
MTVGDPEFIATQARSDAASAEVDSPPFKRSPPWFAVVAALLVMVGGFVIPFAGTLAGLVMVWFSDTWSRKEKWIATLTPVAVTILLALVGTISWLWQPQQVSPTGELRNPVVPVPFDLLIFGFVLVLLVQVGVGIWLLIRARRA